MKTIHFDYSTPDAFWEAMKSSYGDPSVKFADKKRLTNSLIAKKINELAWRLLGGLKYYGNKILSIINYLPGWEWFI